MPEYQLLFTRKITPRARLANRWWLFGMTEIGPMINMIPA
jgi:hypothetical protein